jgi:hypothetical protein
MDVVFNRIGIAMVAVGGALTSAILGAVVERGPQIFGIHFLSVIGLSLSTLLAIWLVWGVLRSGRL